MSSPEDTAPLISVSNYTLNCFEYKGDTYARVIPGKRLFQSTMVHEVVNRGDIFALRLKDSILTIIPGTAEVTHHIKEL